MDLGLSPVELARAVLVFLRCASILFFLPFFGDLPTPFQFRIFVAIGLSFAFYHLVPTQIDMSLFTDSWSIAWVLSKEVLIGLTIGFASRMAFDAIVMAATLVGFQMGFGFASTFIPDANEQMNSFSALHRVIVLTMFLSLSLHHTFIDAIAQSFEVIPLGGAMMSGSLSQSILNLTSGLFVIALELAAPMLVALLFSMAALGLAARAVPQLNVFIMSFPISFFLGLLVYMASFPLMPQWLEEHSVNNYKTVVTLLHQLAQH